MTLKAQNKLFILLRKQTLPFGESQIMELGGITALSFSWETMLSLNPFKIVVDYFSGPLTIIEFVQIIQTISSTLTFVTSVLKIIYATIVLHLFLESPQKIKLYYNMIVHDYIFIEPLVSNLTRSKMDAQSEMNTLKIVVNHVRTPGLRFWQLNIPCIASRTDIQSSKNQLLSDLILQ